MHFNISKRHGYPNIIAIQDSKSILHRSSMMLFSLKSDKMLSCSGCLVLTTDGQQTNKQKKLHMLNFSPNIMNYWMNLSTTAILGVHHQSSNSWTPPLMKHWSPHLHLSGFCGHGMFHMIREITWRPQPWPVAQDTEAKHSHVSPTCNVQNIHCLAHVGMGYRSSVLSCASLRNLRLWDVSTED